MRDTTKQTAVFPIFNNIFIVEVEMHIQGFEYFLVAAEELNITKAAAKLYISQQYLSAHIHRLEEQYGVELFQRRPTLQLTLAGKAMA